MKSISIGMWFGVPGSDAASSPSNSALRLDSSSGLMASSTIAQPSRSMASISDPIETSGRKRSMCGSVMLAPFAELLEVVVTCVTSRRPLPISSWHRGST